MERNYVASTHQLSCRAFCDLPTCPRRAPEGVAALGALTPTALGAAVAAPAHHAAAAERLPEGVAVLERHEVVEDGVDGGREVVEEAGHVVEVLVDGAKNHRLLRERGRGPSSYVAQLDQDLENSSSL